LISFLQRIFSNEVSFCSAKLNDNKSSSHRSNSGVSKTFQAGSINVEEFSTPKGSDRRSSFSFSDIDLSSPITPTRYSSQVGKAQSNSSNSAKSTRDNFSLPLATTTTPTGSLFFNLVYMYVKMI